MEAQASMDEQLPTGGQEPAAAEVEQEEQQHQLADQTREGTEETSAAVTADTAGALQPVELGSLEIQQAEDYSGVPSLMPAITQLMMQITHHLSSPDGSPQLALSFQPLVQMALNLQFQAQAIMPDMSAMSYISPAAVAMDAAAAAGAAAAFDPQALMAAAAAANSQADFEQHAHQQAEHQQQQAQQEQQQQQQPLSQQQQELDRMLRAGAGSSAGRRRQHSSGGDGEEDMEWRQPWHHKRQQASGSHRPQRQRKKSKILSEYYDEEGLDQASGI